MLCDDLGIWKRISALTNEWKNGHWGIKLQNCYSRL